MREEHHTSPASDELSLDRPPSRHSARFRFILWSLFITTMVICAVLAMLVALRRSAQQMACQNNLKQIALALHDYHGQYQMFPWAITYADDGTPMDSWRVRIVPFIDSSFTLDDYDCTEPWNGPNNCLFLGLRRVLHLYRCPSAAPSQNGMCTNYVMLIDDRPGKPNGPPNRPGSAPPSCDEKSAVIVIEIADSDIHWMEPPTCCSVS